MVLGVGFVGAVMAAVVADSRRRDGPARQARAGRAAGQPPQLLENPGAQPRRLPHQVRGPRGRPADPPLRAGEEDPGGHAPGGGPQAGRRGGGGRAVRLPQERHRQRAGRRGGHGGPGGVLPHHRPQRGAADPHPDRDHGPARHHRADRLPDHEEDLHGARHRLRPAAGPQLRAGHAGPQLRGLHPRLLAGGQRDQRRGPRAGGQVPERGPEHPRLSR